MRLLVDIGQHCQAILDHELRDLPCRTVEADEIWTFVRKKQHRLTNLEQLDPELGDQYLYIGFDPRSKLILAQCVGKRDAETTTDFIEQLQRRLPRRIQLSSTGGWSTFRPWTDSTGRTASTAPRSSSP